MALPAEWDTPGTLADVIDRVLDKGLVINADIAVSVAGIELLGIKIRATLASLETAARYGLELPSGTRAETPAWQEAMVDKESCPHCAKRVAVEELLSEGCPWCGWLSARANKAKAVPSGNGHQAEEIPWLEAR
ncbi:MAG: gas vesicle protein [Chloroflexi bacterium]|nr:gas vesicle protein [Chloroflexota bacterium]